MGNKQISKDILNSVKNKTGKSVSESAIQKLASGVKPSTMQNDSQLRQLIKQVSDLVNVPVSEATVNEIIHAVQSSNLNPNNMEHMMNIMLGKK